MDKRSHNLTAILKVGPDFWGTVFIPSSNKYLVGPYHVPGAAGATS